VSKLLVEYPHLPRIEDGLRALFVRMKSNMNANL